jgi:hypothetical protein
LKKQKNKAREIEGDRTWSFSSLSCVTSPTPPHTDVAGHVTMKNAKDLFSSWPLPNLNVYTDLKLTEQHMKALVLEDIEATMRNVWRLITCCVEVKSGMEKLEMRNPGY